MTETPEPYTDGTRIGMVTVLYRDQTWPSPDVFDVFTDQSINVGPDILTINHSDASQTVIPMHGVRRVDVDMDPLAVEAARALAAETEREALQARMKRGRR